MTMCLGAKFLSYLLSPRPPLPGFQGPVQEAEVGNNSLNQVRA